MKQNLLLLLCVIFMSCTHKSPEYTIGVSIDSNDPWRKKLCTEITREASKHSDVRLIWCLADRDFAMQEKQIDSLAQAGADIIIISTDAPDKIEEGVDKVFQLGIPLIVSTKTQFYTAFIGTDNYKVGALLGKCIMDYADKHGYTNKNRLGVIELEGDSSDASVFFRHKGLVASLDTVQNIQLLASACCQWDRNRAHVVTDSLISLFPNTKVIVAHSDVMAIAAKKAAQALYPQRDYYTLGVDAIADGGEGLKSIISGEINASVTNYSQGDIMVQTALKILKCQPYERDYYVPSEIVTHSSQSLMNKMVNEITGDKQNIHFLSDEINKIGTQAYQLRVIVIILIGSLCIIIVVFICVLRLSHVRLRKQLERAKNVQMLYQQQQINMISAELSKVKTHQNLSEKFIKDLKQIMTNHMDDPTFNVDVLSSELGVSRAQLFRKVKTYTGLTPIELMQQLRMKKAQQLLQETDLSIQQVAYSVGIQSPSYFTLQYKKMFGILPTKEQRSSL